MNDEEILESFYEIINYEKAKTGWTMDFVGSRLLGMKFDYDINTPRGKIVFPKGSRINARLLKKAEDSGIKTLLFPNEAVVNQYSAVDSVNEQTGEIFLEAGQILDEDALANLEEQKVVNVSIILMNNRIGPYIRNTLIEADKTSSRVEALADIYRIMRPGEPPTEETSERLFFDLFFTKANFVKEEVECRSEASPKSKVL